MNREISEITPHLYLSGACPVTEENLRRLGITKVLTIAEELPICPLGKEVDVIKISVRDRPDTNLYLHFEDLTKLIRSAALEDRKVLVHCIAGVSRSASICLAYLVRYEGMSLAQALVHVRSRRPVASPNSGFTEQLVRWEENCRRRRRK